MGYSYLPEAMSTDVSEQRSPKLSPGTPIRTISDLSVPWGIAITNQGVGRGQILVAETGADCISSLSPEGEKTRVLGGERGSAEGQFYGLRGISVDADGNILVVDGGNHRLQMFKKNGEFVASVGTEGNGALRFMFPVGIGINIRKKIYVCDRDNHRVQVLNPDLTYCHSFGSRGSGKGQLTMPLDLTFDSRNNVYVADSVNHCIQVYAEDGEFLRKFGSKGGGMGELYYPSSVCMDSSDVLYVVDGNGRVCSFSYEGEILQTFGVLRYACGIAVDGCGHVYVSDSGNNRLQVFSLQN